MKRAYIFILLIVVVLIGCTKNEAPLGSKENPVKMFIVPSLEMNKIMTSGDVIEKELERVSGLEVKICVPTSYAAVVEAFGVGRADVAWLTPYAFYLANKKYDAYATYQVSTDGISSYKGEFIVATDSDIKSIEDIEGRTIGYTDASSASGYIFPAALLAYKGITPSKRVFLGAHDTVIRAVARGQVDVGCTFWSPDNEEGHQDARTRVLKENPDIYKQTRIIGFTEWIPNVGCVFNKDLDKDVAKKMIEAFGALNTSENGARAIKELYNADELKRVDNSAYDKLIEQLDALEIDKLD